MMSCNSSQVIIAAHNYHNTLLIDIWFFLVEKQFLIHFNFKYFPELALPRDVDLESPLSRHPDDCKVYFNGNFPMTCGEGTAFSTEDLTCVPEEEADC